ncbi:hypothetical protein [Xanthomonas pisi]|uniref:hypothetical protein n=1 Tax=Xanthomonas pisi TaxID=56457 RepID=UPI000AE1922C|nr:hypothetical protein [Xanthomonas pisi]
MPPRESKNPSRLTFAGADFNARVWTLPNETPGQVKKNAVISWDKLLMNGESLFGSEHQELLFSLKCFIWTLVYTPQESAATTAGGLQKVVIGVRDLASFMIDEGIKNLDELDTADSWAFAEYVVLMHETGTRDAERWGASRKPTHSGVISSINVLTLIHRQRVAMSSMGAMTLKLAPYDAKSPYEVVNKDLGLKRGSKTIPAIPDEVAIPILNTALRIMDNSAEALRAAVSKLLSIRGFLKDWEEISATDRLELYAQVNAFAKEMRVPMPNVEESLLLGEKATRRNAEGNHFVLEKPLFVLRYLIVTCVAACSIVLQAGTGMRAHELLSLRARTSRTNGWPACLHSSITPDGLLEMFYVEATTAKRGRPRQADWLIGARPVGADYMPPTVRAVLTLNELLKDFRDLGGQFELLITLRTKGGLPTNSSSVTTMSSGYLARLQREFLLNWVDFSMLGEHAHVVYKKGRIRPHQWRPTFATFVFRTNPNMLKALSEHYKHVNDAITCRYYIGNDPTLVSACSDAQAMSAVHVLRSITFSSAPMAGGFSKVVSEVHKALSLELVKESLLDDDTAVRYVNENEVSLWNTPYGRCWASQLPSKSLCNQRAGTSSFAATKPNLKVAHLELCVGCSCLAISSEHVDFWSNRRDENQALVKRAHASGDKASLAIATRRKKQSDAILAALTL